MEYILRILENLLQLLMLIFCHLFLNRELLGLQVTLHLFPIWHLACWGRDWLGIDKRVSLGLLMKFLIVLALRN